MGIKEDTDLFLRLTDIMNKVPNNDLRIEGQECLIQFQESLICYRDQINYIENQLRELIGG